MEAGDEVAGRDDVGLDDLIDEAGPLGAVAGHDIVAEGGGVHGVGGTDCEHKGVIAGGVDGPVALIVERIVAAVVAGGDDDDNAGLPCLLYSLAQGVERVALIDRPTQGQVDHLDVVGVFEGDGGVDGGDDGGVRTGTVFVEGAKVNDVGVRCNAGEGAGIDRTGGVGTVASDEAGDMGAVAVSVERGGLIRDEVGAVDEAAGTAG